MANSLESTILLPSGANAGTTERTFMVTSLFSLDERTDTH
jgi:hypothetical protein